MPIRSRESAPLILRVLIMPRSSWVCSRESPRGSRLEEAIYDEKGVKRVEIDEEKKTVTVYYNTNKTTPEKIKQAIAAVGFDADDVKADPDAYASLDECCKRQ